jgi:hypothetical protein
MSLFYAPIPRVSLSRVCITADHDVRQVSSIKERHFLIGSLTPQIVVLS